MGAKGYKITHTFIMESIFNNLVLFQIWAKKAIQLIKLNLNENIQLNIINSTIEDIDEIFNLYEIATNYQKDKFPGNVWPLFDRSLIEIEIQEQRQFKLLINERITCVWAITFSDPQIWEEKDSDPAIYIHRIATNPDFRGQQFVIKIVSWAKAYAKSQQKQFIRLDTCGHNTSLITHYQKCGFTFLGISKIKSFEGLPSHYHNADVCYFEIKLSKV